MRYDICRPLSVEEKNKFENFSEIVSHLLFHRGFTNANEAKSFLNPDYETGIIDPFLLKDAEKSADRIIKAIKENQKICIYSDYDADGIPGAVMMKDFFDRLGFNNFFVYIPHRHNEGFGLNKEAINQIFENQARLIITVDCGIADVLPVEEANLLGMEVIITDHHEPPAVLPPAFAIIDHKQKDCNYPDKNLCGSAVAFKLIQAILKKNRFGLKDGHEKWLLDLVGIATLSDMVDLVGENRIFAKYGLTVLRRTSRNGLVRLLQKLKINQKTLTEDDVTFMITPRINAASRMDHPMDAFNLLASNENQEADKLVEHLDSINNERKGIVASLVKEAKKIISERYSGIPKAIVLGNPQWKPSLLGLVANTCAEEFGKPAFFWGRDGDGVIKGSCRSEGFSNVVEIMKAVPEGIFIQFGGHKYSGGFTVSPDQIHFLESKINEVVEKIENQSDKEIIMRADLELSIDNVNRMLFDDINRLAPFGIGNSKPIFLFRKLTIYNKKTFGKSKDHIELIFKKSDGNLISAIAFFGVKEKWNDLTKNGIKIDLFASIEMSDFRGRKEVRLRIENVFTQ
jgi:single-stranded-DNA-specific exonuclease